MNKLNIIQSDAEDRSYTQQIKPKTFRELTKARFDREWKKDPEQFNPLRNARERTRIERTFRFISNRIELRGLKIADLGSGHGHLTRMYRDAGGIIDAVDIARLANDALADEKNIRPVQSCVPHTHLDDGAYDLVACTELIGHLSPKEHRLLFNEIARLSKREGSILFSTSIDIHSEDALEKLFFLIQTELEIVGFQVSHHSRHIALKNFFSMPRHFAHASRDKNFRKNALSDRHSIWRYWFQWNSTKFSGMLWKWIAPISNWFERTIDQSRSLLLLLEKLSHSEPSISHIIILARKKPLFPDAGDQ